MANDEFKILVLLRQCRDPGPKACVTDDRHAIKARHVRTMLNPADLGALERALQLKDEHGGHLTVLAMGPKRVEEYLRTGLSMGADRAVRINGRLLEGFDDSGLSRVLSRAFDRLCAHLVCTGNMLEDQGFDAVFPLAAARSGIVCVQNVLSLKVQEQRVQALRTTDNGARQLVNAPLPAALGFAGRQEARYPGVKALVEAVRAPVEVWGLTELGLGHMDAAATGATTVADGYAAPRPDPVRVVTPDPNLPAFDRILSLLSGGVTARRADVRHLSADDTADALAVLLRKTGLLP